MRRMGSAGEGSGGSGLGGSGCLTSLTSSYHPSMDSIDPDVLDWHRRVIAFVPIPVGLITPDGYLVGVNTDLLHLVNIDLTDGFRHTRDLVDNSSSRHIDVVLEVLLHHEEQLTMEVGIRWNAQFLNTLPDRPSVWLITGCKHISIWTLCLK